MSKLSVALFNSMTGQPKEKLYEMPGLITQISQEVDYKNNVKRPSLELSIYGKKNSNFDPILEPDLNINNQYKTAHTENVGTLTKRNSIFKESPLVEPKKIQKVKSFRTNMNKKTISDDQLVNFNFDNKSLEGLTDWEYCILNVNQSSEKFNLIWMMFHTLGFIEKYEIDVNTFGKFLCLVEEKYNYRENPFHNFDHGFTGSYY